MMKIFFGWTFAFVIKIVLSVLLLKYSFDKNFTNNILKLLMIVTLNIITDIGPCLSVLEIKFIELFKEMRNDKLNLNSLYHLGSEVLSLEDLDFS